MNDRERLIELIDNGRGCPDGHDFFEVCDGCKYSASKHCDLERLADCLISHGVTVQKHGRWIFVNDYEGRCSECNTEEFIDWEHEWKRCPNCGAKNDRA